ncbi:MAG: outer membrane beta-barrel protein [Gammaproteobacteria bacterium]|nr:outer membrane beta-barrel protein [Gammaproteobacteria bacterium]
MYKRILCVGLLALGLNGMALADDFGGEEYSTGAAATVDYNPGVYLGGQIGTSSMHYRGSEYTSSNSSYDDAYSVAGRGYIGYAFSQFISVEVGYDYYGRPKFNSTDGNTQDILQHGMDLVGKASLPLDYGFGLYIKGGLAWVYRSALHANNNHFADKDSNSRITPVGALGICYWFAPNMALDLSWTKTMSVSSLPTTDLFTVGIIYKINI